MAKKSLSPEPVASTSPTIASAVGATEGDPIVLVRLCGSATFTPCQVRDGKCRQIIVDGRPCEHVGESPDGTWLYEQRIH